MRTAIPGAFPPRISSVAEWLPRRRRTMGAPAKLDVRSNLRGNALRWAQVTVIVDPDPQKWGSAWIDLISAIGQSDSLVIFTVPEIDLYRPWMVAFLRHQHLSSLARPNVPGELTPGAPAATGFPSDGPTIGSDDDLSAGHPPPDSTSSLSESENEAWDLVRAALSDPQWNF